MRAKAPGRFVATIVGIKPSDKRYQRMFGFAKDKERQRYYLFPGQGGRSARRKHRRILFWSILFGLIVSAAFAGILYFISKPRR